MSHCWHHAGLMIYKRAVVGHPSLNLIARRLQAIAAANGLTDAIYDDLLKSLKQDR